VLTAKYTIFNFVSWRAEAPVLAYTADALALSQIFKNLLEQVSDRQLTECIAHPERHR
jgi:hypothetical protein